LETLAVRLEFLVFPRVSPGEKEILKEHEANAAMQTEELAAPMATAAR